MFLSNISFLRSSKKGFTLIELMVVMTVIAILSTMVLYGLGKSQAAARDVSRQQIITSFQSTLERFYGDNQCYFNGGTCPLVARPNNFCGMALAFETSGYITNIPQDPLKNLICTQNGDGMAGTDARYVYVGNADGQGYRITLQKESGGTLNFYNPK